MGIFDNVETLIINNKEVESITVNSDNSVLYQRADPIVSLNGVNNSNFSTCNLEATVTLRGVPLSGRTVYFLANGVQVGYGVTNSNGVASYSYDYSGVSGNVNMTASYNSFLSETYLISSTLLYENYGDNINDFGAMIQTHGSGSASLYLDNENIVANVSNYGARCAFPITPLTGLHNIRFEVDTYSNNANLTPGIGIIFDSNNIVDIEYFTEGSAYYHKKLAGSLVQDEPVLNVGSSNSQWVHWVADITNTQWIIKTYKNNTLISQSTQPLTDFNFSNSTQYGIFTGWWSRGTLRWDNIKVTRL